MAVEPELRKLAANLAQNAKYEVSSLQREVLDLEAALAEKKAQLDAANFALDRLANFQVTLGGEYQCPWCWILNGRHAVLQARDSRNQDEDAFRCVACNRGVTVRFG